MDQILLLLALLVTTITLGLLVVDRLSRGVWRAVFVGLIAVVLVIGLRVIFLQNDVIWRVYRKAFIGLSGRYFNVVDTIDHQLMLREGRLPGNDPYFVLGSSQPRRLFRFNNRVSALTFSGLAPYEYPFFIPEIRALRPRAVVLFISEWDLALTGRTYHLGLIQRLPENPGYLLSLLARYIAMSSNEEYTGRLELGRYSGTPGQEKNVRSQSRIAVRLDQAGLAAYENLIPERKYGVIFRIILDRSLKIPNPKKSRPEIIGENKIPGRKSAVKKRTLPRSWHEQLPDKLFISLGDILWGSAPYPDKNFLALEEFITALEKTGIAVIILEAQYRPDDMSSKLEGNKAFRKLLLPIVERHPNTLFVPRQEQPPFTMDDFTKKDGIHIRAEGSKAALYSEYVSQLLSEHLGLTGDK